MEIWSEAELSSAEEKPTSLTNWQQLQLLQHAFSERNIELNALRRREEIQIIWLASFFSLTILGSLVTSGIDLNWVAKLFLATLMALAGWYGSEYISQGRDDMQQVIALMQEIRDEISSLSDGYLREMLPDPRNWDVASRWDMGPIDMFLKGSALVAIITLLFA
jgi:hypothetical protein